MSLLARWRNWRAWRRWPDIGAVDETVPGLPQPLPGEDERAYVRRIRAESGRPVAWAEGPSEWVWVDTEPLNDKRSPTRP